MKTGLYLHIPFCRKKCDYCGFNSYPVSSFQKTGENAVGMYLHKLKKEVSWLSGRFGAVDADSVYFGGGTPSLLEPFEISDIIKCLKKNFRISQDAEITIEVNPADATEKRIAGYRDAGVNRVVLGIQTLNAKLHRIIGRCGKPVKKEMLDEFFSIKGISHSIDLITGIPGQSNEELIEDLETITSFFPKHLSVYLLSLDKSVPLFKKIIVDDNFHKLQKESFETAIAYLKEKGYIHYEISNFSMKRHRSQHNMKYWTFQPYIGFGPGAHSFIHNRRYINLMSIREYLESENMKLEEDVREGYAPLVEYILTGLRLREGLSLEKMSIFTGIELPEKVYERFIKLEKDGFVLIKKRPGEHQVQLTERGILFADTIIYEAVEPLL